MMNCMIRQREVFFMQLKEEAKVYGINPVMYGMGKNMPEPEYEIPLDGEGETALYILARNSGEGSDRKIIKGDIELTDSEIRDIHILNEKYERFMLVLNIGGLVNLVPVKGVKNILLLGQLGSSTGDILADIILGKAYPSGKLTMTWADINEYPSTAGFGDLNDICYEEGIYVGYRYFDTVGKDVMYPFLWRLLVISILWHRQQAV